MRVVRFSNELPPDEIIVARRSLIEVAEKQFSDDQADCDHRQRYNRMVRFLDQTVGQQACRQVGLFPIPEDFLLSIVMPVFNEAATIQQIIQRVFAIPLPCELVIVDDGSRDGTREVLARLAEEVDIHSMSGPQPIRLILHESNQGKGAAIKTGFGHVRGDAVVIQDADMEYDPQDLPMLLQPILDQTADVVYGSRFLRTGPTSSPWWHQMGNRLITWFSNLATGLNLTDVETCYKVFRRNDLDQMAPTLREKRFGIELEMTAKLAKNRQVRFCERPICYHKRTYAEGKKIGWRDGVSALRCIWRYR